MLYKMLHNAAPDYLSSLAPSLVNERVEINLRNASNLSLIPARTSLYFSSFLPSVVRDWNNLPLQTRQAPSIGSFKNSIRKFKHVPKHLYSGKRRSPCLHARLRTQCSVLNQHLFQKNIVESPLCRCGEVESTHHYFFVCPFYTAIRQELTNSISSLCTPSLKILLFGNDQLSYIENVSIMDSVHKFILASSRFQTPIMTNVQR